MFLIKSEDITVLNNVSEGLFPMFWIEEVSFHLYKKCFQGKRSLKTRFLMIPIYIIYV